jgi:hypothetical protein
MVKAKTFPAICHNSNHLGKTPESPRYSRKFSGGLPQRVSKHVRLCAFCLTHFAVGSNLRECGKLLSSLEFKVAARERA